VLGLVSWTGVARLERGEFLRLGNEDFVQAVRALGGSHARIIFRHILPNALGPVLVSASFGIAGAILAESTLSFLGFGVPPDQASWGGLLKDGNDRIQELWWMVVFPGLALFTTVTCFNLVGEGIRDATDPKLMR
jgi:peptide/nickel transport system permease protein